MLDLVQPVGGDFLVGLLKSETRPAMGCTELGAAALAAAKAAEVLAMVPDELRMVVSPNVYKNGISVAIPGTTLKGLAYASALGALIGQSHLGLNVLNGVNGSYAAQAERLVGSGRVSVDCDAGAPDPVFLRAEARGGGHSARVTISGKHSRIGEVRRDDASLSSEKPSTPCDQEEYPLSRLANARVHDLIREVLAMDVSALGFLAEAARTNRDAAFTDFENGVSTLGPALRSLTQGPATPNATIGRVQTMTAAASEARMRGLPVPVYSLVGSGNHGITALLAIYVVAEDLGVDDDRLCRALALASLLTIYVKAQTGRLTSYCGCAIAPATGVAAATVYLLNGSVEAMVRAMQSVIGTFAGMLCDGAKLSCAYKVSTVAAAAVQFAHLAMRDAFVPCGDGIVGRTIEETIRYLGILNDPGMKETDRVVLSLLRERGKSVLSPEPSEEYGQSGAQISGNVVCLAAAPALSR